MGNKKSVASATYHEENLIYKKFIIIDLLNSKPRDACDEFQSTNLDSSCIQIEQFKSMDLGQQKNNQNKNFQVEVSNKSVIVTKYYDTTQDLQTYISNVIKMSKMLQIVMYDQLKYYATQSPYTSTLTLQINGFKRLNFDFVKSSLDKKIDLLQFITTFLRKVRNIYLCPEFIAEGSNGFYILNFQTNLQLNPQEIFLAFLRWVFGQNSNFQYCLSHQQMPSNMPIYLQQIYNSMHFFKDLSIKEIEQQMKMVKDKMSFLMSKTDSFYACHFFKKTQKHAAKSDWIFLKSKHDLYFYNFADQHSCNGKLIRKKKKINIDELHVTFDPEDLEILYVGQNSKLIIKASQFEFQSSSSISDIEIKYKIPIKFKNCHITRARNGDLLLLQQNLYRYLPNSNKLIQETKKVSDYIFLSSTRESTYFVIKLSIDIFRNGIRVFYKNEDLILAHTGDHRVLDQISSIRVDIRHVIFCVQIYKGVFVMMAAKNMWILDLNFQCFFSYATISQIKKLTAISKGHSDLKSSDQVFAILNQPFKVDFNINKDGNNVAIRDNILHILGNVQGLPYYLKYSFIHRIGALKLEGYHPLFVECPFQQVALEKQSINTQQYQFNFHQENSHTYKYLNWIFEGDMLVKVYDFKLKWEKKNYQVILQIEKIDQTLKEYLQKVSRHDKKLNKMGVIVLLYKIYSIYEYLFSNSITHRNISVSHICFTQSRQLKIHGWTEPPRNWHVSDFKDYLLTCFNVITYSSYEKISDKIISKHEAQLNQYPAFSQKIQQAFKQSKTIQKKSQIEKNLQVLKCYLEKELSSVMQQIKMDKYIFSFEYKTPRMSVLNTESQKMKKITIVPEQTLAEQFTFAQNDKFVWNEQTGSLYIFTAAHQFYELRIDLSSYNEEKLVLEDYQYLPQNICSSTFLYVKGGNLYSFGGIKKQLDGRSLYCKKIYKFNWKTLSWDAVADMPEPRINPQAVVSACNQYVYLIGGAKELECTYLKIIKFDIQTNTCALMMDQSSPNVLSHLNTQSTSRIFHLSQDLCLFLYWHIEEGDYVIKYISYLSYGFSLEIRAKNYSSQNNLPRQSITLDQNHIHLIRPYGKYSKITLHKLDCASVKNQTIYAI